MELKKMILPILTAIILTSCGSDHPGQTYEDYQRLQLLDLSAVNDTIAYSQTVQLVNDPEPYHGYIIRIDGLFGYLNEDGTEYFSILVQDETKCCMEGMDFELKEPKKYPDDFPPLGSPIIVQGVFDSYQAENGNKYCCLREAEMATL